VLVCPTNYVLDGEARILPRERTYPKGYIVIFPDIPGCRCTQSDSQGGKAAARGDATCSLSLLWLLVTHARTHPFNGPFSGTTRASRYQKGKPVWILLKQEIVSPNGISWAIRKSAPISRQITTPVLHHSVSTGRMPLSAAQPTASKHCGFL